MRPNVRRYRSVYGRYVRAELLLREFAVHFGNESTLLERAGLRYSDFVRAARSALRLWLRRTVHIDELRRGDRVQRKRLLCSGFVRRGQRLPDRDTLFSLALPQPGNVRAASRVTH